MSVFSVALRRRQFVGEHLCLFCVLADGGTMKTVLVLLLLCLSDPGQSDCQADCLSCSNILPRHLSFNTKVKSTTQTHTHTHRFKPESNFHDVELHSDFLF